MDKCEKCGNDLPLTESGCCNKCSTKYYYVPILNNQDAPECSSTQAQETSYTSTPYNDSQLNSAPSSTSDIECRGLDRELTCVLFPGVVKNVDKALQCLGGIKGISQIHSQPQKKRLGLSFQPDNPFVKKLFADYRKTAGVLMKIRVKKVKVNNEIKRELISTDVIGRVSSIFRFDSMCDFQYLPVQRDVSDGPLNCIVESIIPPQNANIDFITGPAPLFVVPASFTRSDKPISYAYTDKRYPDRSGTPDGVDEFHNKSRSERVMPLGHMWHFNLTDEIPKEPNLSHIKNRDQKSEYNPMLRNEFVVVNQCFKDRPIWSLNRLRYHTKLRLTSLKILMPCVAVFMKDGPWKSLWVRFGYDPRKEPSARIYQTLDFRLRHTAGVHYMVTTRDKTVHFKSLDRVRHLKRKNRTDLPPSEDIQEGAVVFRPGIVPTQRQIFYQLCDVQLPEVESLLSEEPSPDHVCNEKLGWLRPNAIEDCRDFIFRYVKEILLATHSEDLKYEDGDGGSSDEDETSGDDVTNAIDESSIQ